MFSFATKQLKQHYFYYLGLMIIQIILVGLLHYVVSKLTVQSVPFSDFSATMPSSSYSADPAEVEAMMDSFLGSVMSQNWGIYLLLSLVAQIISSVITILGSRSIFQKINYPETTIGGSALFNTNMGHALFLPIKNFFAMLLYFLFMILIYGLVGFTLLKNPGFESNSAFLPIMIILFLLMFFSSIIVTPITYLIAYDVDRKYSIWSTFTKGMSIGIKNLFRLLGMYLVIIFTTLLFIFLISILFIVLQNAQIPGILLAVLALLVVLGLLFWYVPWVGIYIHCVMNDILQKNY